MCVYYRSSAAGGQITVFLQMTDGGHSGVSQYRAFYFCKIRGPVTVTWLVVRGALSLPDHTDRC